MKKRKSACSCKGLADQYMTLVTIYAAIINQEFDNADDLEIFAEFLVSLGEQLSLAASVRGNCEDENEESDFEVDVNDPQLTVNSPDNNIQRTYIKNKSQNKKKKGNKKHKSNNSKNK